MDILDIITSRRSIRKFEERKVSEDLLEKVLEAGRWAPSGLNNQPWRFAVIRDKKIREEMSGLTHYSRVVKAADILIAVFMDSASGYHRVKDAQSIGACMQNMLLEAHALGLGAVWLGEIIKSDVQIRQLLGLGAELELMAVMALGHPAESLGPTTRKAMKDLIVYRN
ncbi:MAG: nitroreductase [Nitrospiraceae bacterium]|nr:nitroreductase [Nitrospiraceae bacterium]